MDREIWFEKIAWSYMPIHWKGWAIIALAVVPAVITILVAVAILDAVGWSGADWLPFFIFFVPAYVWLMRTAKGHS